MSARIVYISYVVALRKAKSFSVYGRTCFKRRRTLRLGVYIYLYSSRDCRRDAADDLIATQDRNVGVTMTDNCAIQSVRRDGRRLRARTTRSATSGENAGRRRDGSEET